MHVRHQLFFIQRETILVKDLTDEFVQNNPNNILFPKIHTAYNIRSHYINFSTRTQTFGF